jgi:hypothetical protein
MPRSTQSNHVHRPSVNCITGSVGELRNEEKITTVSQKEGPLAFGHFAMFAFFPHKAHLLRPTLLPPRGRLMITSIIAVTALH